MPPFSGELRDGHLWGRGALDMKCQTAASAVAFAVLARSGYVPNGDVLLIAEADEEDGVDDVGMTWLVRERPDLRCDYALNEGSFRFVLADGRTIYTLCVARRCRCRCASVRAAQPDTRPCRRSGTTRWSSSRRCSSASRRTRRCAGGARPSSTRCSTCWRPATATLGERIERGRLQHDGAAGTSCPTLAGSTFVPTMASASRKRNVIAGRCGGRCATAACSPGTDPEELFGEFRAALAGLDVELELAEPPLGGSRSPLATPLRDAIAEWVDELEPGAAARAGDQLGLHRLALHAGGVRDDRLRFLSIPVYGPGTARHDSRA